MTFSAPAQALSLYTFQAQPSEPEFGLLSGNSYAGSFEFDDSVITGASFEETPLTTFDFTFEGASYGLADAQSPGAFAAFRSGEFVGIEYRSEGEFPEAPPGSEDPDVPGGRISFGFEGDFFFYNTFRSGGTGFGDVIYTAVPEAAAVPAPAPLLGLVGMGVAALRKKGQAS